MRKRLLFGVIISLICAVGTIGILPLFAQDGTMMEIKSPFAGQVVDTPSVPVAISFRNSDNVPVVRFDLLLDGKLSFDGVRLPYGTFNNPLPVGSFKLPTPCDIAKVKAAAGSHTLTVRLTDARGRIIERSQLFYYQPLTVRPIERNAPKVRIVKPYDGDTITQKTDIQVEASDDTELKLLKLFIDGQQRVMTNKGVYLYTWDPVTEKLASGSHSITASAWDIFDNQGDSVPVTVMVVNGWVPGTNQLTPIEQPLTHDVDIMPVGLLIIDSARPTAVSPMMARLPFSNIVAPEWGGAGIVMPNLFADSPRTFTAPQPIGVLAVVPTTVTSQGAAKRTDLLGVSPLAGLLGQLGNTQQGATALAPQPIALLAPRGASGDTHPAMTGTSNNAQELPLITGVTDKQLAMVAPPVIVVALPTANKLQAPTSAVQLPAYESATGETVKPTSNVPTPQPGQSPLRVTLSTQVDAGENGATLNPGMPGTAVDQQGKVTLPAPVVKTPVVVTPVAVPAHPALPRQVVAQLPPATAQGSVATTPAPRSPLAAVKNQYTIKAGDTIYQIAQAYGTTVDALLRLNPALSADSLIVGTKINVPRKAQLLLDDATITDGPAPYIAGAGYTMVSMRALVQNKGGVIVWLPNSREVNAWVNNNYMGVTIGKRAARVNTQVYVLPVAATLRNARTMVPLRFVAKGMKFQISYDATAGVYTLTSE